MRLTFALAAGLVATTSAHAQHSYLSTTKAQSPAPQPVTQQAPGASFSGGGGSCASPTMIPPGATITNIAFDLTAPTSGGASTNPFALLCSHSQQTGIANEEWWLWTATADGTARLSTCSGLAGVDTKIAIYADDCPNITTLDPLACKDDNVGCPAFETTMVWDITAGTNYLIQLGTYPIGVMGGPGDFSIEQLPARAAGQYDSGVTQNAYGPGASGGDVLWLQVFDAGLGATINSVDAAFGTPGGAVDPDGTPATIVVYSGDPLNGMTQLATESILTASSATDTPVNYPLSAPIPVTGLFTIGVHMTASASTFPAPADMTVNSFASAWFCWDATGAPIDLMDPTTAQVPPTEMQFGFVGANDCVWMLRVNAADAGPTFADFCNGDGGNQMGCTDCPCGNNALPGTIGGCVNSSGGSTRIAATGNPSVSLPSGDTTDLRLTLTGAPSNAFCVMLSGGGVAPTGMANPCFGMSSGIQSPDRDGLRCAVGAGQAVLRHGGRSADGAGEVLASSGPSRVWGGEAQPAAGIAGQAAFVSGQTRYFQVTHREDAMAVCMRGLNTSQAVEVTFTP